MELDESLNQSPQGDLEKIGYTSSNEPLGNCCKVSNKYLIRHVLGGQNEGSTIPNKLSLDNKSTDDIISQVCHK